MIRISRIFILVTLGLLNQGWSYPGKVVNTFPAPYSHSTGMTFDGEHFWVADYEKDKLIQLSKNGTIVHSIKSPSYWPTGLAWDGEYLWNADDAQDRIYKIDPRDGTILFRVDAPCKNPFGLAWNGETLWLADRKSAELYKIDLTDGTAIQTIQAPSQDSHGLTFDGKYLWSSDRIKDELYMINPDNGKVLIITESPGPYSSGLTWDGTHLWNVDFETDSVYQCIHHDDDIYKLSNQRYAEVCLKHHVFAQGKGEIRKLDVYFALPEDRPYQTVESIQYSPAHYKVIKDHWGQPFAAFSYQNVSGPLPVKTTIKFRTKISAVDYYIFPDKVGNLKDIPKDIAERYTADGSKYRINDQIIQSIIKEILNEETRPFYMAQNIYDYVRNTLEYKLEGGWNVAPFVLKRGTGSCSEYTFSFIALCRAAGIPARYVGAIVVRGDDASIDEYFHRWPEVYLPGYGWVPMDPQAGDKQSPRDVAMGIGHLPNRFLITTQGGGDSDILGWYYNSHERFKTDPGVQVKVWSIGEWEPITPSAGNTD